LTAIGESGAHGAHAARPVNKENNQENENVTHLLHSMVERNVKEIQIKSKSAMKMFHVQVS